MMAVNSGCGKARLVEDAAIAGDERGAPEDSKRKKGGELLTQCGCNDGWEAAVKICNFV